jgi:hypothetical protein
MSVLPHSQHAVGKRPGLHRHQLHRLRLLSADGIAQARIVTTYISERFPTHVRTSGYGLGYSLAVIIPAFAGAYTLALQHVMPCACTPVVLIALSGILIVIGALIGPGAPVHRLLPGAT